MALRVLWNRLTRRMQRSKAAPINVPVKGVEQEPYKGPTVRPLENAYLSDDETKQIASSFRSLRSQVYVNQCAVTMYFLPAYVDNCWIFQLTGVPVLVWLPDQLRIIFYIAELGTGLPLWDTDITKKSKYEVETSTFHSMKMTPTSREKVGFRFDCEEPAFSLFSVVTCLLDKRRTEPRERRKRQPVIIDDIHTGYDFDHITNITNQDTHLSMRSLVYQEQTTYF